MSASHMMLIALEMIGHPFQNLSGLELEVAAIVDTLTTLAEFNQAVAVSMKLETVVEISTP